MHKVGRVICMAAAMACATATGCSPKDGTEGSGGSDALASADTPARLSSSDWSRTIDASMLYSAKDQGVTIATFIDMESAASADFHRTLVALDSARSGEVSIRLIHYPEPGHALAIPAANAAECAFASGKFASFVDVVFENQQTLAATKWSELAARAGISNDQVARAIEMCAESGDVGLSVQSGMDLGNELSVRSVPTVIVAGQRWAGVPSLAQLIAAVDSINGGPEK